MRYSRVLLLPNVGAYASVSLIWLVLQSAVGGEIDFGLVGKDSGRSLPNGTVTIEYKSESGRAERTTLELPPDGRVEYKEDALGLGPVNVEVRADGFVPLAFRYRDSGGRGFVGPRQTVEVPRAVSLRGRVEGIEGESIEGATLFFSIPQSLSSPRIPSKYLSVVTDGDGQWKTEAIAKGAGYVRVEANHPNYDALPVAEADVQRALRNGSELVIRMKGFYRIQGRVQDPMGKAVESATVMLGSKHGVSGMGNDLSVQTDAEGRFVFDRIEAGSRVIFAQADGWAPAIDSADVEKGGDEISLQLQEGVTTRLLVTDFEDQPIAGAQIRVSQWDRCRYPGWDFRTDDSGRFEWEHSSVGAVEIDFIKPGFMSVIMSSVTTGGGEQTIRLGPELKVIGSVVDAVTGEPIRDFTMTQGIPRESFDRAGNRIVEGARWSNHTRKSYRNGHFNLTFSQPIVVGTREPMDFMFRVEADGYESSVSPVVEADAREAKLRFELHKGGAISGRIVMPAGEMLARPSLYYSEEKFGLFVENGNVQTRYRNVESIPVKEDGAFEMREPTETATIIAISDQGYRVSDSDQLKADEVLELVPWSVIEGRLMLGNRPGVGETVALWFADEFMKREGVVEKLWSRFRGYEALCDAEGRFRFTRVPAGEMSIAHVIQTDRPLGASTTGNELWGANRLLTIEVKPGSRQTVDVGGVGASLHGRIRIPDEIAEQVELPISRIYLTPIDVSLPEVEGESDEKKLSDMKARFWSGDFQSKRHWYGGTPTVHSDARIHWNGMIGWRLFPDDEGRFELWNVPPGAYQINAMFSRIENKGRMRRAMFLGAFRTIVTVPETAQHDVGEIRGEFQAAPRNSPLSPYIVVSQRPSARGALIDSLAQKMPEPAKPTRDQKVSFSFGTSPKVSQAGPGRAAIVIVRLRILEGHHIYSLSESAEDPKATTLTFDLPDGFEASAQWQESVPTTKGGHLVHEGTAAFGRAVSIRKGVVPGNYTLPVTLKYQVCDDAICWPPVSKILEVPITIE